MMLMILDNLVFYIDTKIINESKMEDGKYEV